MKLWRWADLLTETFYPRLCPGCDAHLREFEHGLCFMCRAGLPLTYHWNYSFTPIEGLFYGHVPIERGVAFLEFSKGGKVQNMIHRLKYEGRKEVGLELGRLFGEKLQEHQFFIGVDLAVPIPLHPSRLRRRGYNQAAIIASGLCEVLGFEHRPNALERNVATESQTRKKRYDRFGNTEGIFTCPNRILVEGKHVVLVDDVVTTGSTLKAGVAELLGAGAKAVSIAALAHPSLGV